jgi:hypothetical protein
LVDEDDHLNRNIKVKAKMAKTKGCSKLCRKFDIFLSIGCIYVEYLCWGSAVHVPSYPLLYQKPISMNILPNHMETTVNMNVNESQQMGLCFFLRLNNVTGVLLCFILNFGFLN